MKINQNVRDSLDGKGLDKSIYAVFEIPPVNQVEIRPNLIYRLCAEQKVIHLGCTDHLPLIDGRIKSYTYVHRQLSYIASKCVGVDINAEAVAHVNARGISNVIVGDMTVPGIDAIEREKWDWLVIPDVLEHVPNPAAFLQAIDKAYGKYIDKILITVPNAFGCFVQDEPAFRQEVVNLDHCFWFTPYTLCKVVHAAGFELDELYMCSYENPVEFLRKNEERYKKYPLLLNTVALTAHRL